MKMRKEIFILISIIILSFLLRIYDLGGENLWFDESTSVIASKKPIVDIMSGEIGPNLPLYYITLHFWIKLFGDSEFSIRFPSVIFGILSIYVIFKLGKLIFDERIGILSAFITAISLYHIRYSQEARPYILFVFTILLSNYYFIKFLREKEKERKNIIGYIGSSIMMIYSHYYGIFYVIFQNIYYLFYQRRHITSNIKSWMVIQGIILSSFILWISNLLRTVTGYENVIGKFYPTFNFIYGTFELFVGNGSILYIFMMTIILGLIIRHNKKDIENYIFMIFWALIPFVVVYTITYTTGNEYRYYSRYFIASFPAIILLFSKGIFNFIDIGINFDRIKKSALTMSMISIILSVVILQIPLIEGYYQNVDKEQWKDVANYIKENKKDGDMIILYPKFSATPFGYYYNNASNYIGINNSAEIYNITNNRIWLISSYIYFSERRKELTLIEKKLSETHIEKDVVEFTDVPPRIIKIDLMTK